ncbi:MAG: PDZ domain-containing protein [Planctomycetes bacterium]|nr:PDZ domain-containing protein [Planctomycetota bacterium]
MRRMKLAWVLLALFPSVPVRSAPTDLFNALRRYLDAIYFEPDRIAPPAMLESALLDLESSAEEVFVDRDEGNSDSPWRIRVHDRTTTVDPAAARDLAGLARQLSGVVRFVKSNYHGKTDFETIEYATANGMLQVLDPHTNVFSKKQFEEFFVHIQGEIFGVGMYVGVRDGKLTVIAPLKDTPAWHAGLRRGDHIIKIDDESTVSMTTQEAVARIRGGEGTPVTFTIMRKGEDKARVITCKRSRVEIKSVESTTVKPGIGYIKMVTFSHTTTGNLEKHLRDLEAAKGGMRGLILDLRDNSGGLLDQAAKTSDLFLERGDIVLIAHKGEVQPQGTLVARDDGDEPDVPMVVIVNQGTASGAEIVAGALQKNDRALVIGEATFGKGTVQQLRELDERGSQLKITVSEYLLPGKVSIQENGVTPDIELKPVRVAEGFIDFEPDKTRFREKDYASTVRSRFARDETPACDLHFYEPEPAEDEDGLLIDPFVTEEFDFENDPTVLVAASLLEVFRSGDRPSTVLRERKDAIDAIRRRALDVIADRVSKRGIDWSAGSAPAAEPVSIELSHSLREDPPKDETDSTPLRKLVVKATLTNRGDRPLYRILGRSDSDYDAYKEWEFLFGRIEPGASVTREATIDIPYYSVARTDSFEVRVVDESEKELGRARTDIVLPEVPRPSFAFRFDLFDAADRSPIDRVPPGGKAILRARIENEGPGTLFQGIAILKNELEGERAKDVFLEVGRHEIRDLVSRKATEVEFSFQVREDAKADACAFKFIVSDARGTAAESLDFQIPSAADAKTSFRSGRRHAPPRITALSISGEAPEKRLVVKDPSIELGIRVASGSSDVQNVLVYAVTDHRRDKVYFHAVGEEGERDLPPARIRVKPGINILLVVVSDPEGLQASRSVVVRGVQALAGSVGE